MSGELHEKEILMKVVGEVVSTNEGKFKLADTN